MRAIVPFLLSVGLPRALRHHAQLRLLPYPASDAKVLLLRAFQVFEILLKRRIIELRQELRLDADVVLPDVVDELTFRHRVFTFTRGVRATAKRAVHGQLEDWRASRGVCGPT